MNQQAQRVPPERLVLKSLIYYPQNVPLEQTINEDAKLFS